MPEPGAEIEEAWQLDQLRQMVTKVETAMAWMAETIDELMASAERLAAAFSAYREKYPPTDGS